MVTLIDLEISYCEETLKLMTKDQIKAINQVIYDVLFDELLNRNSHPDDIEYIYC